MNNFKSCVPCVCTGSGCKQVCEKHNISAQCEATAKNTVAQINENIDATNIQQNQQNQQNFQKPLRRLEVVSSSAEVCQNDPEGYQAAAFVPSKVPRWRKPPYLKILIPEHQITPHIIKDECHDQAQHCA